MRQQHLNTTEPVQPLCRLDDLADGASKEVILDADGPSMCLIRQSDTVFAYVNSCPHTGSPLNWNGDQFLTREGDMIQCAVHGALFRITDGQCLWGPCLHQHLISVPVIIRDGFVLLAREEDR